MKTINSFVASLQKLHHVFFQLFQRQVIILLNSVSIPSVGCITKTCNFIPILSDYLQASQQKAPANCVELGEFYWVYRFSFSMIIWMIPFRQRGEQLWSKMVSNIFFWWLPSVDGVWSCLVFLYFCVSRLLPRLLPNVILPLHVCPQPQQLLNVFLLSRLHHPQWSLLPTCNLSPCSVHITEHWQPWLS